MERSDSSGVLRVEVTDDAGAAVGGNWSVGVVSIPAAGEGPATIIALETGTDGTVTLPVLPGEYEIRTDRSFVEPFAKLRVTVAGSRTTTARLSIVGR